MPIDTIDLLLQYRDAIDESSIVSKSDANGIITYANKRFCQISGYSEEELIGKSHSIIRHPNTHLSVFKEMWESILSNKTWHGKIENRHKDGRSFFLDTTIKPILNIESGKIIQFISISHDITADVESKRLLEAALVQKNEFFANVSHELRTPLNVIINFTEDVIEDIDDSTCEEATRIESKSMLKKVTRSAKHLLSIIENMITISKLGDKNTKPPRHNTTINEIINDAYNSVKDSTKDGVALELQCCSEKLICNIDNTYMNQIILNLLSNAIKYTSLGKIKLSLSRSKEFAIVEISDTGRGIAKEKLDMIFEPFSQVDSFDEGTGLGLKIVKDICTQFDIKLEIKSETSVGTMLTLKMKLANTEIF